MSYEYYFKLDRKLSYAQVIGLDVFTNSANFNTDDEYYSELDLYAAIQTAPDLTQFPQYNNQFAGIGFTGQYFDDWNTPPLVSLNRLRGYWENETIFSFTQIDPANTRQLYLRVYSYLYGVNSARRPLSNARRLSYSIETPHLLSISNGNLIAVPEPSPTYIINYRPESDAQWIALRVERSFFHEYTNLPSRYYSHTWTDIAFIYRREVRLKPCYFDLAKGYEKDTRSIPQQIELTATNDTEFRLQYYRVNPYEKFKYDTEEFGDSSKNKSLLTSIDWTDNYLKLKADTPKLVDVEGIVLGTLDIPNDITIAPLPANNYPVKYLKYDLDEIANLFAEWMDLYNSNGSGNNYELKVIAAHNDYWDNNPPATDIGFDENHPLFKLDNTRTFNYHFKPQSDGSFGDLEMDSPRIVETHTALNAGQYLIESNTEVFEDDHYLDWFIKNPVKKVTEIHRALNAGVWGAKQDEPVDPDKPEDPYKWNLGEMIKEISRVLGLRRKLDGTIDRELEKKIYLRKIRNNPQYNREDYSTTCMGKYGRLTPHLTNQNGDKAWDVTYDLFQMIEAVMEHLNRSLGVQQGTEIKVKNPVTGKLDYYQNQLALTLEIYNKLAKIELDAKESFNLVSVIANSVNELFSGIGIPIMFKTLFNRYGNIQYLGHQFDKGSVQTWISTLKINVGMILGNMLVSKSDNPLMKFIRKVKGDKK